mmetsp:Transcript_23177/g.48079  ORF Transcript_23177/g.48079 Transcript_23177/m.48079 type:complete len:222 (-) Transcript_23177:5250-5915(-)
MGVNNFLCLISASLACSMSSWLFLYFFSSLFCFFFPSFLVLFICSLLFLLAFWSSRCFFVLSISLFMNCLFLSALASIQFILLTFFSNFCSFSRAVSLSSIAFPSLSSFTFASSSTSFRSSAIKLDITPPSSFLLCLENLADALESLLALRAIIILFSSFLKTFFLFFGSSGSFPASSSFSLLSFSSHHFFQHSFPWFQVNFHVCPVPKSMPYPLNCAWNS